MYIIQYEASFKRDAKKFERKGGNVQRLREALHCLKEGKKLPDSYRDHQLKGKMRRYREMHIELDWLLVYEKDGNTLRIYCIWLTTHKRLKERQREL